MEMAKKCLGALIVGGLLGVLGQLFFVLLGAIPGLEPKFSVYGTLLLMGVFTLVTFPLGFYQKITEIGGFGAMFPFSGLAAAVAASCEEAKRKGGSIGKSIGSGVVMFLRVIGVGAIFALIIAAIFFYLVQGGKPVVAAAQAPVDSMLLGFVFAFLGCGVLSALFHLFMMLSKIIPPTILVGGFSIGALLVAVGTLGWMQAVGGAGVFITVMGAGGATGASFLALFAGNVLPLIEIVVIFALLTLFGIIAGFIRSTVKTEPEFEKNGK